MTESACGYPGDRDEALVAYLYDDTVADAAARAMFEVHLTTCVRCSEDLAALRGVRAQLAHWSPPEPKFVTGLQTSGVASPQSPIRSPHWWHQIPAWAQVAAALLVLGVSAGIANLDVRYDASGLSLRTGWSTGSRDARSGEPGGTSGAARIAAGRAPSAAPLGTVSQSNIGSAGGAAPWRADLDALERQLKTEFHAVQAPVAQAQTPRASDAEIVRRVRTLIEESEKRQQRELALRLADVIHDVNANRQADLVRMNNALGVVQNRLGVQVLKNTQQVQQMDYYIRTSQRQ
jgi:hypothetical protein